MAAREVYILSLPGPSYCFSGISSDNRFATSNYNQESNPRAAAQEVIQFGRLLLRYGIPVLLLPPQERPNPEILRRLGFHGNEYEVLEGAYKHAKDLLLIASSSAAVWVANAATITPSSDSADGVVHITPANLNSYPHRWFDSSFTTFLLDSLFCLPTVFKRHPTVPGGTQMSDEGAACHFRLTLEHDRPGLNIFVFSRRSFDRSGCVSLPGRHTSEACNVIARQHKLTPSLVRLEQMGEAALQAGAFHPDLVAFNDERLMISHELALQELDSLRGFITRVHGGRWCDIGESVLPLQEALRTYFFNSVSVLLPTADRLLITTERAIESPAGRRALQCVVDSASSPISHEIVCVPQNLRNGGGPACLRLRIWLTEMELESVNQRFFMTDAMTDRLATLTATQFRDRLNLSDLCDPTFLVEARVALDKIAEVFGLCNLYSFQQLQEGRRTGPGDGGSL
jgi:succinylarginine dihydrolase